MLPRTRVIFFQFKLFRLGTWVLFGHVKVASVGCAYEFNLQGRWLRHDTYSLMPYDTSEPNFRLSLKKLRANWGKTNKMSSLDYRLFDFLDPCFVAFLRDADDDDRRRLTIWFRDALL